MDRLKRNATLIRGSAALAGVVALVSVVGAGVKWTW